MKIKVVPKKGEAVRDDKGKEIPAGGCTLFKSIRIARLIREGSLVVVNEKEAVKK